MLQQSPMYAYLPATDVARARAFYEGTLGFRPSDEIAGGVAYSFADGTGCFLYPTPNAGTNRASQAFWRVNDVEREVADLRARGVTFEEYDLPGMKTVNGVATAGGAKSACARQIIRWAARPELRRELTARDGARHRVE